MASIILSANSLQENPQVGTVIGTLSVLGGKTNETFTYTLADSLMERFEIKLNAATGLHELLVKSADSTLFDYDWPEGLYHLHQRDEQCDERTDPGRHDHIHDQRDRQCGSIRHHAVESFDP
jgi:hypothetical protein